MPSEGGEVRRARSAGSTRAALRRLCVQHHVQLAGDNEFQRRARLLQALWRESRSLPIGEHGGRLLGSRIAMPFAEETLPAYLTDNIRTVVRAEVLDPAGSRGRLFARPRIFNDLLSSQPLCFNLFGELSLDLELASRVFARITKQRVARVYRIGFEESPGRGDQSYTGDRSAFDVFVEYQTAAGALGFLGIEVKYHEDLRDSPSPHRERYDEIARTTGVFVEGTLANLRLKPLQQIWRDHLLALSLLAKREAGYSDGCFVFVYPASNTHCSSAVEAYSRHLADPRSFSRAHARGHSGCAESRKYRSVDWFRCGSLPGIREDRPSTGGCRQRQANIGSGHGFQVREIRCS